jgi:RNA polymerase sigma-70 factor (ECF subfamily)
VARRFSQAFQICGVPHSLNCTMPACLSRYVPCLQHLTQTLIFDFLVSQRLFVLPIPLEAGFELLDENQKSLFMVWLSEHGSSVMKVARAYTLTSEDCQDLAQEILLQAWRSLPKFEGKASAATWFYRVALHIAMNWKRKDLPRRLRQQPLLEVQTVVAEGVDSGEQAQQRETIEQLYNAIHQLPKADAALVLLYLDDLSYQEMADVLGISESNVGVKLNRAKKALSELMNGGPHGT